MKLMPRLVAVTAITIAASAFCVGQTNRAGEARTYDVLNYDADIRPEFADYSISGTVNITLKSLINNLSQLKLDANELTIDGVEENHLSQTFRSDSGYLLVSLSRPAARDEVRTLTVRYHGKPTRGVRFFPDHMYAFYNTSHWLVCDFDPGDKATLSLKLTLLADLKVVANGRLIEKRALPGNSVGYLWRQERPIPSYIFGFVAGQFQEVTNQAGSLRLSFLARTNYSRSQIERIFGDTADMRSFFEERSGVSYPGERYTQVLASGYVEQEMSDFTVMRENYGDEVLADARDDNLAVHEFAHQWWGNNVTCARWADFWLNEAMAEFMMAAYREHRFGRDEYERDMELARESYARSRAAGGDRPLAYHQPIPESQAGSLVIYDKGSLVLNLLRRELGEKAFWEGIRRYTQNHFGDSVTTSDLQTALEEASRKSLSRFFDQWIYRAGVPDIVARHRWYNGTLIVELEQRQKSLWDVPLAIAVETFRGRERHAIVLTAKRQELRIPLAQEPLSVRIDDGGVLPMNVVHERTTSMLLFQLVHEPDIAGRIDAMNGLQSGLANGGLANGSRQLRLSFVAALQDRIAKDSSRLVRKLAQETLAKMPHG
jgi:aminopeptidase N